MGVQGAQYTTRHRIVVVVVVSRRVQHAFAHARYKVGLRYNLVLVHQYHRLQLTSSGLEIPL